MTFLFRILALLIISIHVAAQGTQFITGPCASDLDCASACCGFKSGKCAGPVVAQERDGGCGFGNPSPNDNAAKAITGGTSLNGQAGQANSATPSFKTVRVAPSSTSSAAGTQFITGACTTDADCASARCGFKTGKCAAVAVAQERDGGCGFRDTLKNRR
ncbi:hypothetical protein C7974DRAFT_437990 [Boeremia exigua]|uniref:uncharacterized protein n=1 Tax=Boeremia exigua TaxID=749465 RepID=UPI001E8CCA97|nr:uncharacterized protein C7974DRAFT_437990 [Boeremia exigua]KAH6612725.1 hypothetical protein C7974DRAFT_437990 [Boeremia exigua]